jgi:hypothetical protein
MDLMAGSYRPKAAPLAFFQALRLCKRTKLGAEPAGKMHEP